MTPRTVAHQAPLSTGFPRQGHCGGLPSPSSGDLLDPGIEPMSPALQAEFLLPSHLGSPCSQIMLKLKSKLRGNVDLLEVGFTVNGNSKNGYCVWSSVGSSFTFKNMTKPVTEPQFQTSISALKYIKYPAAAAHLASGLF